MLKSLVNSSKQYAPSCNLASDKQDPIRPTHAPTPANPLFWDMFLCGMIAAAPTIRGLLAKTRHRFTHRVYLSHYAAKSPHFLRSLAQLDVQLNDMKIDRVPGQQIHKLDMN